MTQTLYMVPAWERAMSDKDRKIIENTFQKLKYESGTDVMNTYLRHAYNHRGQLLYTVLIHNYRDRAYPIKDKKVTLIDMNGNAMSDTFTLPVHIPPHASMPWTFIFPASEKQGIEAIDATLLL